MQQNELMAQIEDGQPPVIVDLRSTYEYKAGHVSGALHIPFWTAFTTDKLEPVQDRYELLSIVGGRSTETGVYIE